MQKLANQPAMQISWLIAAQHKDKIKKDFRTDLNITNISQKLFKNLIKISNTCSYKIVFCYEKLNRNKQMKRNYHRQYMPVPSQQRNGRKGHEISPWPTTEKPEKI